ncbi:unnamed protein product, partial [Allacma fusca]
ASSSARRIFRCWNCGCEDHKLSDCKMEIKQVNKNFWRKYFRLMDSHERERHKQRYLNFLMRQEPNDNLNRNNCWDNMTKEQLTDLLLRRHLAWRKEQWSARMDVQESQQVENNSGEGRSEEEDLRESNSIEDIGLRRSNSSSVTLASSTRRRANSEPCMEF